MNSVVTTLAPSSFIGSSYLQIRRTTIESFMSLFFVKIPSPILELAPLEHLKKIMDNVVITLAHSFLLGLLHSFRYIYNKDNHKSLDEFKFHVEPTSDWS